MTCRPLGKLSGLFYFDDANPVAVTRATSVRRFDRKWLYREEDAPELPGLIPSFQRFESLSDFIRQRSPAWVLVHRGYALGDIVMLLPILSAMRRVLAMPNKIMLATRDDFIGLLGGINYVSKDIAIVRSRGDDHDYGAQIHMDLDSVLEADHRGGRASDVHRMDLYAYVLGLELQ